ncbi:MAG: T9SS type A sorting domain-containing protein, partial [Flavobacteriales bacterium]|nr:T9SS type A sorting domain-containing protein [Flavobacteriales bacterium]MBL7939017.1 T9SS type A sorting domain-containing protein [Flavobacteriales bacterium]
RDSQRSVAVSPNPTSDKLFLGGLAPGRIAVDIRSADGRLVQTLNTFARDLDVGELEPGTYTLTIWNAEKPLVARFVKL